MVLQVHLGWAFRFTQRKRTDGQGRNEFVGISNAACHVSRIWRPCEVPVRGDVDCFDIGLRRV